jgi:peroxin-3
MLSATTNTTNTTANSETDSNDTRTKAELWNEVKMLSKPQPEVDQNTISQIHISPSFHSHSHNTLFHRSSLPVNYVTLLARGKYVSAVLQQERQERLQERMQERMEREMGSGNLLLRGVGGWMREKLGTRNQSDDNALEELFASMGLDGGSLDGDDDAEEAWPLDRKVKGLGRSPWLGGISEEVESKYLTMSWWLLHVGNMLTGRMWVRRGVEEVFNESVFYSLLYIFFRRWHRAENGFFKRVSLKTKLAAVDLHRLISDVRRTNLQRVIPSSLLLGNRFLYSSTCF